MQVCVFCASGSDLHADYVDSAHALGQWIGARGHTLVWGGCNVGLMYAVGRAATAAGAHTVAVIPRFLVERGLAFDPVAERIETEDLAARKSEFRRRADFYVALPGGVGTWEEVLEVLALRKLGRLAAPIVLVNVRGYYDRLLEQIDRSIADGFSPPDLRGMVAVAADAGAVATVLDAEAESR
jgi:uncharacterized protein (TIGR00730 family)